MPGLFGIISRQHPENCDRHLRTMLASMQYEDFYNSGLYSNAEMSVYVGWTCHPKSFCDCLPVTNQVKDLNLFFAGEVFEDQHQSTAAKSEIAANNAGRLIRLYEECGEKFIEKLNGWFCGLLLDKRRDKAFLFNDRYGMCRIFIHENKDGLYFSSEAKALLAVLPEVRGFDPKSLGEFLTCGCTLGSRSLYKRLNVLPTGALWISEHGEVKKRGSYFNLGEWVGQQRLDEKQFSYRLVESFGGFVKRYSEGLLPVGISLTGGLDSRMVMACLDKIPGGFPCYTFGSMYRDTFDVKIAREVAKVCERPFHVLVLGEEFLRDFPKYLEKAVYISDGYLGMSGAAELYVNSLARSLAPVRLTGNCGGELLRGVRAFKYKFPRGGFISPELQPFLREAQTTFQELETTDAVSFALFHQAQSQGYGRLAVERSQVVLRTPFMDNDLVKLVYQAPPLLLKSNELSGAIISRYKHNLLEIPTDRGLLCDSTTLRSLTRRLHRNALIKAEYWSSLGMPNWLAAISRYGVGRFLEKSFLGRDKFEHFHRWTEKRFAGYIADVLLQGGGDLREFFNLRQVEKMIHEHMAGRKNYLDEIDKLLTLTLAHRNLKGGAPEYSRIGRISSDA
ncbi:MAG: asparagine synthase-related protein [Desulfobacterales bacterium]